MSTVVPAENLEKEQDTETEGRKSRKKLLLAIPIVLLLVAGVGYKTVLAPKPEEPAKKIEGALVSLEKEFVVNLADGHYGKVSVALQLSETPPEAHVEPGQPVHLAQEAMIRAIVTDELTGLDPAALVDRAQREHVLDDILAKLEKHTDEPVEQVLFTDIAVQ